MTENLTKTDIYKGSKTPNLVQGNIHIPIYLSGVFIMLINTNLSPL